MPPRATTASSARSKTSDDVSAPAPARATRSAARKQQQAQGDAPATTATKSATSKGAAAPKKTLRDRDPNASLSESQTFKQSEEIVAPRSKPSTATKKAVKSLDGTTDDREPIKAFLRIRPSPSNAESQTPYLKLLSSTEVLMTPPTSISPHSRTPQTNHVHSTYTFTRVFPPDTLQPSFFTHTTLPLVQDLLNGDNGLIFTYGVTNSGKTYTIQGGNGAGQRGLLPRTLDVVFNSVDGLISEAPFRPCRLGGVELDTDETRTGDTSASSLSLSPTLTGLLPEAERVDGTDRDETVLKVDPNFEHSIWVSYAEVYNEKVFDLLGSSSSSTSDQSSSTISTSTSAPSLTQSRSSPFLQSSFSAFSAVTSASASTPLLLKRQALQLKSDPSTGGKYIANLQEIRVRSAEEAKRIIKVGQINRRVFGTVMNAESSRSHAIFTIRIIKVPKGAANDTASIQTSRLSIVDLAGSERSKNTQTTGERLKEAGNINKSLMVLGQCMEVLRTNQRKLANVQSHGTGGTGGVGSGAPKLGIVPFRHSKLTELFQDFFVGEGRAAMIVNVNPYDTGYDENSHVMRFSALAREVSTVLAKPGQHPAFQSKRNTPVRPSKLSEATVRQVKLSIPAGAGKQARETLFEIYEEAEAVDEDVDDQQEGADGLIQRLFEELDEMRAKLYEAEMKCVLIESETREEVMREMEDRMKLMENVHARRMMDEVEEGEMKMDKKIDMLYRAGLIGTGSHAEAPDVEDEDEGAEEVDLDNVEASLAGLSLGQGSFESDEESVDGGSPTNFIKSYQQDRASTTDEDSVEESAAPSEDEETESESEYVEEQSSEWASGTESLGRSVASDSGSPEKEALVELEDIFSTPNQADEQDEHSADEHDMADIRPVTPSFNDADDSVIIIPHRFPPSTPRAPSGKQSIESTGQTTVKKKKRLLGNKAAIMTEDEIARLTASELGMSTSKSGSVRRMLKGGS